MIIDWKKVKNKKNEFSIRKEIESNSEKFKKSYIDYINNIKKAKLNNKNIIEYTNLFKNYNLWSPGIIEEKSFYNSTELNDTIFFLAIKNIIKKNKSKKFKIINFDINKKYLLKILDNKKNDIEIEYDENTSKYKENIIKKFYSILPLFFQSLIQILILSKNLFIKKPKLDKINFNNEYDIFFSSTYYLKVTSNKDHLSEQLFGTVPNKFSKNKSRIFLTNFHKDQISIFKLSKYFNSQSEPLNHYIIVNSLFKVNHFFKLLFYYLKIYFSF